MRSGVSSCAPSHRGRKLGAVGATDFGHRLGDMGADRTEADAKDARDIPIGTAASYEGSNFIFSRCQSGALSATQQRTT